jgi:hypothetical protein
MAYVIDVKVIESFAQLAYQGFHVIIVGIAKSFA